MTARKFNFDDTPVAKVADAIRNQEPQAPASQPQEVTNRNPFETAPASASAIAATQTSAIPAPAAPAPTAAREPAPAVKAKKTENGIVVYVPMTDYMQLSLLKIQTGRTLKDLVLQAVHEFVDRNRVE